MTTADPHRLELLVIQPTPFCNLDCEYRYLPDRSSTTRISEEVLRRVFEQVLSSSYARDSFTVVWHAGEPLVLPVAFYERAIALIAELNSSGLTINHSFQTNGTLITPAWCEFVKRHHVGVGVSVDGPAFLHDARRKTRSGKGTHARVMRGIRCLQEHGIDFHVISVLTRESLNHADELFQFYVENGLRRVGFNVEEIEGVNLRSSLRSRAPSEQIRGFFGRFLELNRSSVLEIREFDGLATFIGRGAGFIDRNQENTPLRIINVDCAGNFSTFSPELLGCEEPDLRGFHDGQRHARQPGVDRDVSQISTHLPRCGRRDCQVQSDLRRISACAAVGRPRTSISKTERSPPRTRCIARFRRRPWWMSC